MDQCIVTAYADGSFMVDCPEDLWFVLDLLTGMGGMA
jgi:hypothetical protein